MRGMEPATYYPPPAAQYYLRRCRGVMAVELACAAHHPWSVDRGWVPGGGRAGSAGGLWPHRASCCTPARQRCGERVLSGRRYANPRENLETFDYGETRRCRPQTRLLNRESYLFDGFDMLSRQRITCASVFPIDRTLSWICGSHFFRLASAYAPQDLVVGDKSS